MHCRYTVIPWYKDPMYKANLGIRKEVLVYRVGTIESSLESTLSSSFVVRKHLNPLNTVTLEFYK